MPLHLGDIILNGKYRILALVGEGGMARVWLAEELTFGGRRVVLKEPRDDLAPGLAGEVQARYQREVQVCAALEAAGVPNIVRVLTAEPHGGGTLLVMDYMPGGDLASLLDDQPAGLPLKQAVAIALDLLRALEGVHAHELEIVHRDIKPSNVLFDRLPSEAAGGGARLSDFGLAQLAGVSGRSQMQGGQHPGTPLYMAPEQEASTRMLTPAADLYALGCVLFEMLTGERYKRQRPGTRASALRTAVPGWLDEVVAKALAEDPWKRWESAGAMAEALGAGWAREWTRQEAADQVRDKRLAGRVAAVRQLVDHDPEAALEQLAQIRAGESDHPKLDQLETWARAVQEERLQAEGARDRVVRHGRHQSPLAWAWGLAALALLVLVAGLVYVLSIIGPVPGRELLAGSGATAVREGTATTTATQVVGDASQPPAATRVFPPLTWTSGPAASATVPPTSVAPSAVPPPTSTPVLVTSPPPPAPTHTATETDTPPPSDTPTHTPTATETPPPSDTPTSVPTATATLPPGDARARAPTATETPRPRDTPTRTPTVTDTPPSDKTPPGEVTGRIAFSAGGRLHIVRAADGRDTIEPIPDLRQPDYRRDGQQVIAKGFRGEKTSLWTINADTGAFLREQSGFTDDFSPFWAPAGNRFAYASYHHGLGDFQMLYVQDLDDRRSYPEFPVLYGTTQMRGTFPVWMESDWLAFTGCDYWPNDRGEMGGSRCGLYRVPRWGGPPAPVELGTTEIRATDEWAGQLLVMSRQSGDWEVYLMPSQGGQARNLSQSPGSQDGLGTFSPNGRDVAFVSDRGGSWAIRVVRVDGSAGGKLFDLPAPLTGQWTEEQISWAP